MTDLEGDLADLILLFRRSPGTQVSGNLPREVSLQQVQRQLARSLGGGKYRTEALPATPPCLFRPDND